MIHVIAIITAKPGQRAAMLAEIDAVTPTVRAETGCLEYQPTIDATNAGAFQTALGADTFMVVEKWTSVAALQAHINSPHMAEYAANVKHLLAARTIHVLSEIPSE